MSLLILGKGVIEMTVITIPEVVAVIVVGVLLTGAGFAFGRLSK